MVNNNKIQGFTLVELAMVMAIFGLLLSGFGYGLVAYQKQQKYKVTKHRMAAIQKGLDEFLDLNGRLPCNAPMNIRPDQAGFGFEAVNVVGGARRCRNVIGGTLVYFQGGVGGPVPHWNRVGSVPVRSLNLPDSYMVDGWGTRFTYVVSERQASEDPNRVSTYANNAGVINVVDTNGNSVIDQSNPRFPGFPNFAEYVVISHGEDQVGGISLFNSTLPPRSCMAVALGQTQAENCTHTNANPNIVVSDVISDGDYDDIVVYKAGTSVDEILPSGAVVGYDQFFNESGGAGTRAFDVGFGTAGITPASVSTPVFACPAGYSPFVPAQGRFIMGATFSGAPFNRTKRHSFITASPINRNYLNLGQSGGNTAIDAGVSVPPYVTTFFCEKL